MQVDGKMHVDCWIQQVTTRVGAVTCWIQQSVSPKQVVGFSCLFNSEVDQLISKFRVPAVPTGSVVTSDATGTGAASTGLAFRSFVAFSTSRKTLAFNRWAS